MYRNDKVGKFPLYRTDVDIKVKKQALIKFQGIPTNMLMPPMKYLNKNNEGDEW